MPMINLYFANTILSGSFAVFTIIAVIALSCRLDEKYTPDWRLGIWKIISVFLLLPIGIMFNKLELLNNFRLVPETVSAVIGRVASADAVTSNIGPEGIVSEIKESLPKRPESLWMDLKDFDFSIFSYIWAAGVIAFIIYHVIIYIKFKKRIKNGRQFIKTASIDRRRKGLLHRNRRSASVYYAPEIPTPMVIGVLKPEIYLPYKDYDERNGMILKHELMHCARNDLVWKFLFIAVNAVYWYNPLVYIMTKMAGKDIELCCDYDVIKNQDSDFKKEYSDAILKEAIRYGRPENGVLFACMGSGKRVLASRFKNIFAENKKNGSICVIAATLVMASITGIAYANIIEDKVQVDSPEYQVKIEEAIAAKLSNPFVFSDEDRYKNDADYVPTQEEIDEIRNFDTLAAWLSDETGNYKVGNVYSISKSEAHYNLTDGFAPPQVLGNGNRSIYWKDADGGWQLKKGDTLDFRIYYDGERMRENPKQRDLLKFGYFRNGEEYYDLMNIEGGEELAFRFEADKDGEYAFYMFNPSSYYIIVEAVVIEG